MALTQTARFLRQSILQVLSQIGDVTSLTETDSNGSVHIECVSNVDAQPEPFSVSFDFNPPA